MRLELHPAAEEEAFEAAGWYDDHVPGLGDELLAELDRWFTVILDAPQVWALWPGAPRLEVPVRRCLLDRFDSYAVAYQAYPDHVRVLAVVHLKRRPFYWSERIR